MRQNRQNGPHLTILSQRQSQSHSATHFQDKTFLSTTVGEGLSNKLWSKDINDSLTVQAIAQHLELWHRIQSVQLLSGTEDTVIQRWTFNQTYSAQSAYRVQFKGLRTRKSHSYTGCHIHRGASQGGKLWTQAGANQLAALGWPRPPVAFTRLAQDTCLEQVVLLFE